MTLWNEFPFIVRMRNSRVTCCYSLIEHGRDYHVYSNYYSLLQRGIIVSHYVAQWIRNYTHLGQFWVKLDPFGHLTAVKIP